MRRVAFSILILILVSGVVLAHPHFRKTITASIQKGPEFKLEHITLPYNEARLKEVKENFIFNCGYAKLTVSKNVESGNAKIPAGTYLLRARAKTVDDWTLILLPESAAGPGGKVEPEAAVTALKLQTKTLTGRPKADHLEWNIMPGHGATDGKIIISLAFGSRVLESVFTVGPNQTAESR